MRIKVKRKYRKPKHVTFTTEDGAETSDLNATTFNPKE